MKRILVLCLVVLMMAGCAKEEKTVNRAVFAWEGVEEADEQLLENYRIDTVYADSIATAARYFCHALPLTAHGHCPA